MKKRLIGTHIRLEKNFMEGLEKAVRLDIPLYQSFLIDESGNYFDFSESDIENYIQAAEAKGIHAIIHSSYWISITNIRNRGFHSLKRETELVQKLKRHAIVVHPGSTKKMSKDPFVAIKEVARAINVFQNQFPNIQILIENSAHGGFSFGGSLQDFRLLLEYIADKEKIGFCIDTSHAHAFGYDIVEEFDEFMQELDQTIGFSRIKLLHLNDTIEKKGSKIDRHGIIGEGLIGLECLKKIVQFEPLKHADIILELPKISEEKEQEILKMINQWT
jgi:deoxyribonuclease-4